ncbi:tubulin--tyrosine ligase-like protein 12 isoform X2 [Artemia franciscana]|nr:hypothetical protein QYM36_007521 [Artemia franciscana]
MASETVLNGVSLYQQFVALHREQLVSSGVPVYLWEALFYKLEKHIFDAGAVFGLMQIEYEEGEKLKNDPSFTVLVTDEEGIQCNDPSHIYLIDHAWTFRPESARDQLIHVDSLRTRMRILMEIEGDLNTEELADAVMSQVWKYASCYSIGGEIQPEKKVPIWYVMDEFGSRINHSDQPNCRVVPFFYITEQAAYSLLFPIKDIPYSSVATRDYIEGPFKSEIHREALLLPWKPTDFTSISLQQREPDISYFTSGRKNETLRYGDAPDPIICKNRPLKVYTQYPFIAENLRDPRFEITEDENSADICWYVSAFKDFETLSLQTPNRIINQFPFEYILTVKDLLGVVCRRKAPNNITCDRETLKTYPSWLPATFDLNTEIEKFAAYFQARESKGIDNHWICKPFNLARSLDTHVTNNLSFILRLPFSGPKIAQKYVHDPVLFHRPEIGNVKFDMRYLVLLRSVKPLKAFVYNRFWLRFSNKPFELAHLEDYERHFTVMNYGETELCQMYCHDFVQQIEEQYPEISWTETEEKIINMLKDMLTAATEKEPPIGIAHNPQSRAMYAADLMLSWENSNGCKIIEPKLLEVNFSPDCERACDYYPDFYDNIFSTLFLDESKNANMHVLFDHK